MREDYCPASTDVVMKLNFPMGAIGYKVGNCVSDCQAWHFRSKSFCFPSLSRCKSGREVEFINDEDLVHEENVACVVAIEFDGCLHDTECAGQAPSTCTAILLNSLSSFFFGWSFSLVDSEKPIFLVVAPWRYVFKWSNRTVIPESPH